VLDIQQYLERIDAATLAKIPLFIMLCEQKLAADIKFLGNLTVNASTMTIGASIIDKPARWRKTVSMNVTVGGERQPVLLRKYEYIREYWPNPTSTDVPKFYCDYDYTHWLVGPTPNAAYNFEVLYYERAQPLDSSNQTNWFTQYSPQAMLYGSLLQAMPYLKNDARLPMWKAEYDEIVRVLKGEDLTRIGDRQSTVLDS